MAEQALEKFRNEYRRAIAQQFGEENLGTFWGNSSAKIGHISQAPSLSVIKNKRPFSDKSGERLRNEWYDISYGEFYNPDNFYITAIGMYYPGKNPKGGTTNLRTPLQKIGFQKRWN